MGEKHVDYMALLQVIWVSCQKKHALVESLRANVEL